MLLLGLGVLAGCGQEDGTTGAAAPGQQPSTAPSTTPGLPDSYDLVLTASCGERGFLGVYDVQVRDGKVTQADPRAAQGYEVPLEQVPTLAGMLQMPTRLAPPAEVDLKVDQSGVPRSVMIDHHPEALDDEECYEVSEFVPVR